MAKYKRCSIIMFAIIALIVILNQFTAVRHASARTTAFLYVALKHNDRDLKYEQIEYSPQFGDYMVKYRDADQKPYTFQVSSKSMPFLIVYDPLDPGA